MVRCEKCGRVTRDENPAQFIKLGLVAASVKVVVGDHIYCAKCAREESNNGQA